MTMPRFPGEALTIDSGVLSLRQGHFTVSNLHMKAGTKLAFMNAYQAQLHGRLEVASTDDSSVGNFVTVDAYYRSIYDYQVMDAEIFGKGNIVWKGRSTSGVPEGAIKITSINENWTGTSTVTIDDAGVIAPAMKYVDSHSLVGGDHRAPRIRFTTYFRSVSIAARPVVAPYRHTLHQHISLPHL